MVPHSHLDRKRLAPENSLVVAALQLDGPQRAPGPEPAQDIDPGQGIEQVEEKVDTGEKGDGQQDDEKRQQGAHPTPLRLTPELRFPAASNPTGRPGSGPRYTPAARSRDGR